ncbi:pyruvoyl-dependent arginine decarboxylase [Candidatus Saccharibacteria bacterium]|nr:pyruvoyl-dependent arginine decarboxylase [Candidatus Saccharibacteria bacterium]
MYNSLTLPYPNSFFITQGIGVGKSELVAFDDALIQAKISNYNLVKISSILPKRAVQQLHKISLTEGSILPTAYATVSSKSKGDILATAIAVGIPKDPNSVGVIMENHSRLYSQPSLLENITKELEKETIEMVNQAMENHKIAIETVICKAQSVCIETSDNTWTSLISAICIW